MRFRNLYSYLTLLLVTSIGNDHLVGQSKFEDCIRAVVTIAVYEADYRDRPIGIGSDNDYIARAYERSLDLSGAHGSGSGFLYEYRDELYVVTNNHVVSAAKDTDGAVAAFSVDRKRYSLKLLGGDTFYDIAVLKFQDDPGEEFKSLVFQEEGLELAESVYSVGNPLGEYPYSISDGIISGFNRDYADPLTGKHGYLQHTATVIWGNSGGPLVNASGNVVGINTWIKIHSDEHQHYVLPQLNFALQGQLAKRLVEEIIDNEGRVQRCFLGLEFAVSDNYFGISSTPRIQNVIKDGPSFDQIDNLLDKKIYAINDQRVRTLQDIIKELEQVIPGQKVVLSVGDSLGNVGPIHIKSSELDPGALSDISKHFVINYSDFKSENLQRSVVLNAKDEVSNPQLYFLRIDQGKKISRRDQAKKQYELVGAGLMGYYGNAQIFRLTSLVDLGAVIRLCSIQDNIVLYSLAGNEEELTSIEINAQDADFNSLRLLYY